MKQFQLEVRLFAYLRDGRDKKVFVDVDETTTIQDILNILDIDPKEASLMLINGKAANRDSTFSDGDYLSLFPPVGGG